MTDYRLRISGEHFTQLRDHLFPGDGLEAVAFILCGRKTTDSRCIFLSHKVVPVPYEDCDRRSDRVTWNSDTLASILDDAHRRNLSILKIHSHTSFFEEFSSVDDESDSNVFEAIEAWTEAETPNASAVMLPDGRIFGRCSDGSILSEVAVAGDELFFWRYGDGQDVGEDASFEANAQLFGKGTTMRLRKLRVAIVGCSGTGSVVIELLARLGVGTLLLVDHDRIEHRNLNRIINAKKKDVGEYKAQAIKEAIESHGLETKVEIVSKNLFDPGVVGMVAASDVVFGCMDTAEGRHLLNRLATFYLLPYFDLGVHLSADGNGGINEAGGVVHYVQPGRSSLFSRGAYGLARVKAEGLYRTDPVAYEEQKKAGYIDGVDEKSPAVASINATIASLAVNEFLARLHPFRSCSNEESAVQRFNFMEALIVKESETDPCPLLVPFVGRGDIDPTMGLSSLSL